MNAAALSALWGRYALKHDQITYVRQLLPPEYGFYEDGWTCLTIQWHIAADSGTVFPCCLDNIYWTVPSPGPAPPVAELYRG